MEPASIRTKNPGAMWPGPVATKWGSKRWIYLNDGTGQGGNGKGNKIAIFDTWTQGICAQLDLWRSSPRYRGKTLRQALRVWSGGNSSEAYVQHVIRRIPEMTPDTIMDDAFWKGPLGLRFLKVQASHEAGKTYPAPAEAWVEAQRLVFGNTSKAVIKPVEKVTVPGATGTGTTTVALQSGFSLPMAICLGVAAAAIAFVVYHFWQKRQIAQLDKEIQKAEASIEQIPERNGGSAPEGDLLRGNPVGQDERSLHPEEPRPSGLPEPVPPVHGDGRSDGV